MVAALVSADREILISVSMTRHDGTRRTMDGFLWLFCIELEECWRRTMHTLSLLILWLHPSLLAGKRPQLPYPTIHQALRLLF